MSGCQSKRIMGVKKKEERHHRSAQLHKIESNPETWIIINEDTTTHRQRWEGPCTFHEDRWLKTACSHEYIWEWIK